MDHDPILTSPDPAIYGWKIHLNVPDAPDKPDFIEKTLPIIARCRAEKINYKVGHGGLQEEGKGMTIYIGDRRKMDDFARRLVADGLDGAPPIGDTLMDDQEIVGNVRARFEFTNKAYGIAFAGAFHPLSKGHLGIPYLRNEILFSDPQTGKWLSSSKSLLKTYEPGGVPVGGTREDLAMTGHLALIGIFKDHYLGDGHGPHVDPALKDTLLRSKPVAYGTKHGTLQRPEMSSPAQMVSWLKNAYEAGTIALFNEGKRLLGMKAPTAGARP